MINENNPSYVDTRTFSDGSSISWMINQVTSQDAHTFRTGNKEEALRCERNYSSHVVWFTGASEKSIKNEPSALKHDTGKLPLDLIDPDAIEGLAAVLQFGAKKYEAHNWRQGFRYSRLLAAMLRHIFAIMRGQYLDSESGLPHIDHVGCCWMFLSNMMKTRPDLDDLQKNARATD